MSIRSIVDLGRRLAATALLDSGIISDRSFSTDELGGNEELWTPRVQAISCRVVQPRDPALEGRDGLLQQAGIRMLLVEVGTNISENCRITINGEHEYVVVGSLAPHSETAVIDRYHIREI